MTTAKNNYVRYGTVAMTFHWIIAILIITNVVLGVWFVGVMAPKDAMRRMVVGWHESIGITVLILSILRLGWRLMNPIPKLPSDFSPMKRMLARGTHYLLYALMIIVPFLGWAFASAPARPLMIYGQVFPKLPFMTGVTDPVALRAMVGPYVQGHIILGFLLFALALAHIAAAVFYHYMIRKDQILQRMIPGTEVSPMGIDHAAS